MPHSIHSVQPRLDFIPPAFNPLALQLVHCLLPILLRFRTRSWLPAGVTRIETQHGERLVDLYRQFQAGKIRFLMAFRHVEVDDPLCGLYLLSRAIPRSARQQGVSLRYPLHSHFVYERGMPLWAGAWLGWLFSRLGGAPIHRGKQPDWTGLRTVRDLFVDGKLPMTVAPEGATNGHSEIVSPLEPGAAQLGFWCVNDLAKAGRSETVLIVPIGIQYRYINPPWRKLDWLLKQTGSGLWFIGAANRSNGYWRSRAGLLSTTLSVRGTSPRQNGAVLYSLLSPNTSRSHLPAIDQAAAPNQILTVRLHALLDRALQVAEDYFGLSAQGSVMERLSPIGRGWLDLYLSR